MKQLGSIVLDVANECLWRDGVQLRPPPKPFAVLRYFVEHPGRLITHDELLDALWPDTYVQPQVLRTYVQELRKLLGDDACQPQFIQTVPKRGYCFVAPLADCENDSSSAHLASIDCEVTGAIIVGRQNELAQLRVRAKHWQSGVRQVIFISGETGIGKTALVDEFCRLAAKTSNAMVARGQCVAGVAVHEDYYPVQEALSQLCSSPKGAVIQQIFSKLAPAWLTPQSGSRVTHSGSQIDLPAAAEAHPKRIAELCAALDAICLQEPLIIVLEDLHWADLSTLGLISAIAQRRAHGRLMLILTYRENDRAKEQFLRSMKQELLIHHRCIEIPLVPLSKREVISMLEARLNDVAKSSGAVRSPGAGLCHDLSRGFLSDLADVVHRHSEGNPLFANAILDHLIHQQYLVCSKSSNAYRWEQQIPFEDLRAIVPEGLAQILELEIQTLPLAQQRILEAGSLMPIAFPAWAIAAALNEDPQGIDEACEQLACQVPFLKRIGQDELPDGTSSDVYIFTHGLYREVLSQRQSVSRRARRHVRIAERLSEIFAGREGTVAREIALHYEAASNWPRAVEMQLSAALHARQRHSHYEAQELLKHALKIADNLSEPVRTRALTTINDELSFFSEAVHRGSERELSASK